MKITPPVISGEQNGTGDEYHRNEVYDLNGNLTWVRDEREFLTANLYDPITLAVVRTIQDVLINDENRADLNPPLLWVTPQGGGLNLVTDYKNDLLGRRIQTLEPWHPVPLDGVLTMVRRGFWTVYMDPAHERREFRGYIKGTDQSYTACVANPVSIVKMDFNGAVTDQIQAVRTACGCGEVASLCECEQLPLVTGGLVTSEEEFPQWTWCRWRTFQYDDSGQSTSDRRYFLIPEYGTGRPLFNYAQTDYGYDSLGRLDLTRSPVGTLTRFTFTGPGWLFQTFVGTEEPSGPGSGNTRMVAEREYDDGESGGDGNLTKLTLFTGPADPGDLRITTYDHDEWDRLTAIITPEGFREVVEYDNQNRSIAAKRMTNDATPQLLTLATTAYDDAGRVFENATFSVVDSEPDEEHPLKELFWFDPTGNVIKHRPLTGRGFEKTTYDGVGRALVRYTAANPDGNDDPASVVADLVLQQVEFVYDAASNQIFQRLRERYHDAPVSGEGGVGPLGNPGTANEPPARVYYSASYPDPLGRVTAEANFGTNGGVEPGRPDLIPASTDTVLVSHTRYSARGEAAETEDANGILTRQKFDDAGRLINTVENAPKAHTL